MEPDTATSATATGAAKAPATAAAISFLCITCYLLKGLSVVVEHQKYFSAITR
jgi:hypothetical protein